MLRLIAPVLHRVARQTLRAPAAASLPVVNRRWGSEWGWNQGPAGETEAEFDSRWEMYFNHEDLGDWELRKGINTIHGFDLCPEPKIIIAALKACRRLNDFPMTVRILEIVKDKSAGKKEIYDYVIGEVRPTMNELGINTPEELGLAK